MEENKEYVISDLVWARVVQIVQEGLVTGVDVTDLMRQIRVEQPNKNSNVLELTSAYRKQVKESHERMIAEVEKRKQMDSGKTESSNMTELHLG